MQTEVVTATNALEGFATTIEGTWTDQPFQTQIGSWNIVPLSTKDLSSRVRKLASRLGDLKDKEIDEELLLRIQNLPNQISWFQANTLPQISSGNLPQVVSNFDSILQNIEQFLPNSTMPDWEEVAGSKLIPRDLARKIRSLEAAIKALEPRAKDLDGQVQRINDAHSAAADLPTDLQMLREAREEVGRLRNESEADSKQAKQFKDASAKSLLEVSGRETEAEKLIKNIESAYSAATTAGLAASFTERASSLSRSTWIWVALLASSLVAGGLIGAHRLADLQALALGKSTNSQWIWINSLMSLLAVAAPVWFAWIATRQIGQRFRLAEDYAFKASVARAYEGYRREAARLDPELEARLFASALDRLEEAPLRFLSIEEHGSPYEALFASTGFQRALEKFPNLRETAIAVIDRAAAVATPKPNAVAASPSKAPLVDNEDAER